MKFLCKFLVIQLCCTSLMITDAMARGYGGGGGGNARAGSQAAPSRSFNKPAARPAAQPAARPAARPAAQPAAKPAAKPAARPSMPTRTPITGSRIDRPAPTRPTARPAPQPAARPAARPTPRPTTRPAIPTERPATLPSRPTTQPTLPARPGTRPNVPTNRPSTQPSRPTTRPTLPPDRPSTLPARPGTRPGVPTNRPSTQPSRPTTRPTLPTDRPSTLPARPGTRPTAPGNRPSTLPARPGATRPGNPGINRPSTLPSTPVTRPGTRPGNVTYPNPVNRPGRPTTLPAQRPGINNRPIQRPDFGRPGTNRPGGGGNNNWWNAGNNRPPGGNWGNNIGSGNTTININNNFQNNINWSTNRNNWGYNPWWNRPATRPWYGGSWSSGWGPGYRPPYYRPPYYPAFPGYVVYNSGPSTAEMIGWGLVGWSLGKLIFDSGYSTYSNPYPTQAVPTSQGASVTYQQPITIVATETAPKDDVAIAAATERSESHVVESQAHFKQRNYLAALESANQAIAEAPGDGALHEYRALILFALGKYGEAAGVLNPVLASGPGWDWATMVTLYNSPDTYAANLESLERYSKSTPDNAAARFLLGYHYMVCGHVEAAAAQFESASQLQPADSVSRQLADLLKVSSDSGDHEEIPEEQAEPPVEAPAPIPLEKLAGAWQVDKGDDGTIRLDLRNDGSFAWSFTKAGDTSDFDGEFSMNDDGLLVLDAKDSQMVARVELPKEDELTFVLAGGPPGDPGLAFKKVP